MADVRFEKKSFSCLKTWDSAGCGELDAEDGAELGVVGAGVGVTLAASTEPVPDGAAAGLEVPEEELTL